MAKTLDLPDAPEVKAYDAIVDTLLAAGLPIGRLVTWSGDVADDDRLDAREGAAAVRLLPCEDPDASRWHYPGLQKTRFTVAVELAVQSGDVRDAINLWHAVRAAFYPADQAGFVAVQQRLRAAGVESGQVMATQNVSVGPDQAVGRDWFAAGKLAVEVSIPVSSA